MTNCTWKKIFTKNKNYAFIVNNSFRCSFNKSVYVFRNIHKSMDFYNHKDLFWQTAVVDVKKVKIWHTLLYTCIYDTLICTLYSVHTCLFYTVFSYLIYSILYTVYPNILYCTVKCTYTLFSFLQYSILHTSFYCNLCCIMYILYLSVYYLSWI